MRPSSPQVALLGCVLVLGGCAESHTLGAADADIIFRDSAIRFDGDAPPPDADVDGDVIPLDGGSPRDLGTLRDAGATADAGFDAGPPPPECDDDDECDDGSECTEDRCVDRQCENTNPLATCERFEGVECAGSLATRRLTINRSFCIPGFAINNPSVGNLSLCQGQRCSPGDANNGCLITLESTGDPSSEPSPDVLRVSGRVTRIAGTVPFTGVIPNPLGGGTLPLNCRVTFAVGTGLPLRADLTLSEQLMCGTDRDVSASADVDLSMLSVRLTGTGFDGILCSVVNGLIGGQISSLLGGLETQLESGIRAGLNGLDCGTCDSRCPADLTCIAP